MPLALLIPPILGQRPRTEKPQIYLPVTYALNTFGLAFATISSLFVWLFLEKRQEIALAFRTTFYRDGHGLSTKDGPSRQKLQLQYKEVPAWWYSAAALVALGVGLFAHEYYPVQLRWYGVIFAMAVSAIFFIPVSFPSKHRPSIFLTMYTACLGVCHKQHEDSNRHLLLNHRRIRVGRKGSGQHLVLQRWIHFRHQGTGLCTRPEARHILQCLCSTCYPIVAQGSTLTPFFLDSP